MQFLDSLLTESSDFKLRVKKQLYMGSTLPYQQPFLNGRKPLPCTFDVHVYLSVNSAQIIMRVSSFRLIAAQAVIC